MTNLIEEAATTLYNISDNFPDNLLHTKPEIRCEKFSVFLLKELLNSDYIEDLFDNENTRMLIYIYFYLLL